MGRAKYEIRELIEASMEIATQPSPISKTENCYKKATNVEYIFSPIKERGYLQVLAHSQVAHSLAVSYFLESKSIEKSIQLIFRVEHGIWPNRSGRVVVLREIREVKVGTILSNEPLVYMQNRYAANHVAKNIGILEETY